MVLDKFFTSAILKRVVVPPQPRQNKEDTVYARAGPTVAFLQVDSDIAIPIGAGG